MQSSTEEAGTRTAQATNVDTVRSADRTGGDLDSGALQRSTTETLQGVHFTADEGEDLVNILRGQNLSDDEIARLDEKVADLIEHGAREAR